jgi:hypothetical protein
MIKNYLPVTYRIKRLLAFPYDEKRFSSIGLKFAPRQHAESGENRYIYRYVT